MQAIRKDHIRGIDVSKHQPAMPWVDLYAEGIQFVYIKASEGVTYDDPDMMAHYNGAKSAGLKVGFYHYARPYNDPIKEVENFLDDTKGLEHDLPYALDIETTEDGKYTKKQISDFAVAFLTELERRTGEKPLIYTYTSFAKSYLDKRLAAWPVWIAHYDVDKPGANGIWDEWAIFQYTSSGGLKSYQGKLDLNVMEAKYFMPKQPEAPKQEFRDVPKGYYFYDDIHWAASNGLIVGSPQGDFNPTQPVTRAQLAAILRRLGEKK